MYVPCFMKTSAHFRFPHREIVKITFYRPRGAFSCDAAPSECPTYHLAALENLHSSFHKEGKGRCHIRHRRVRDARKFLEKLGEIELMPHALLTVQKVTHLEGREKCYEARKGKNLDAIDARSDYTRDVILNAYHDTRVRRRTGTAIISASQAASQGRPSQERGRWKKEKRKRWKET